MKNPEDLYSNELFKMVHVHSPCIFIIPYIVSLNKYCQRIHLVTIMSTIIVQRQRFDNPVETVKLTEASKEREHLATVKAERAV